MLPSIIVEMIFSWKLQNNLSYWLQMWQQQFSQAEGAAERSAKYQHLGIIHLRLQKWLENVWFRYLILVFTESSKPVWFLLILPSNSPGLLDSTFRVYFCKLNQLDWLFSVVWLEWYWFLLSQCTTGTYTKFSIKITFTPWYAHVRGKRC